MPSRSSKRSRCSTAAFLTVAAVSAVLACPTEARDFARAAGGFRPGGAGVDRGVGGAGGLGYDRGAGAGWAGRGPVDNNAVVNRGVVNNNDVNVNRYGGYGYGGWGRAGYYRPNWAAYGAGVATAAVAAQPTAVVYAPYPVPAESNDDGVDSADAPDPNGGIIAASAPQYYPQQQQQGQGPYLAPAYVTQTPVGVPPASGPVLYGNGR